MDKPKQRVTLDLSKVAEGMKDAPEVEVGDTRLAERAKELIEAVMQYHGSQGLTSAYVKTLSDDEFRAAHQIADGGDDDVALRIAAETLDPHAFGRYVEAFDDLMAVPDPTVEDEFI